jgi:pimeloyl-ACP methyl ester carboxylesterase
MKRKGKPLRVQFIHGLESSPQSTKALLLAEHFESLTPAMDTADFAGCVALQRDVLEEFRPDVLIGSSFGGAVAVELLQRGYWRGPTLLLAQAALRRGQPARLPDAVPIWIVHGSRDEIVAPEDSRLLAAAGSPRWVRLIEVDDDHPLRESVESGKLIEWVAGLSESATQARPDQKGTPA